MSKAKPKGPTPSLIGGTNGRPKRITVQRRSECFRCHEELPAGVDCVAIPKLGGGYSSDRRICNACFILVLAKTAEDLADARKLVPEAAAVAL
ncbi:hypothetical protein [Bradyrhizobium stylosanthis]|uniref:Uncharacterized protein n=1 Tax=Bradyrhizobium stylosanthis TaxID=1803665 RepID=A0A560CVV8_9BRAD|nr:hypothetical protein [Bradyrhizobium stylosanthis]TWA88993.1 hypothetical protein FBZ96_1229 [Bradyrhizobium stylosanthis]